MGMFARAAQAKGFTLGSAFIQARDIAAVVGGLASTGESITREKALRYSAFFAAVKIISEDVAKLPLHVYVAGTREKATSDPIYDVLHRRPHPEMTSFRWRETLMGHLLTWGNAYCAISRDGTGAVRELLPLRPDQMVVERNAEGELVYRYLHSSGQAFELSRRDVFHVPGFGWDGMQGYSLLALMRDAIGLGLAHETFGASFYRNGARPSVVATHPTNLSDEAAGRIEARLQKHTGVGNQFRVLVLEEDLKLTTIGISAKDSQFLEGRDFQVEEMARFLRLSPHKLMSQKPGAVAYASVEERNIDHVVDTLGSWTERWEQEIDLQLLPPERYVKLDVRGLLKGNSEKRWAAHSIALDKRVMTPNEVRDLEDMDPVPWGDEPLSTPNNNAPNPTAPAEEAA